MIIHVVRSGENINTIAHSYGKSVESLIQENELKNSDNLVVGQAIVIVYPIEIHTIQEGDTLEGIAEAHNVTLLQLLRNNSFLTDKESIDIGETLVIKYEDDKKLKISTNGYAFPYIDRNILKKSLPFLTYLSIFNYTVTENGEFNDVDDIEIINLAKDYGVASIMVLSNITITGAVNMNIFHNILNSKKRSKLLIDNVITILKTKGFYGVNIDTPYILPEDRQLYTDFISETTDRLNNEGFKVFVTITPTTFKVEGGINYEEIDYTAICQKANGVILLSYSWGHSYDILIDLIPLFIYRNILRFITTQIPPEKITVCISNIGYVWGIPYVAGISRANSITDTNAILLASEAGTTIYYNEINHTSYFYILNNNIVYFQDARSIDARIKLVSEYELYGHGIWLIMEFPAQMFLVINTQYDIEQVI